MKQYSFYVSFFDSLDIEQYMNFSIFSTADGTNVHQVIHVSKDSNILPNSELG